MAGETSPGGNFIPGLDYNANIAVFTHGLFYGEPGYKGLNRQTIQEFASLGALTSAYPSPTAATAPPLVLITGKGLYQFLPAPYNLYSPVGWEGRFRATQSGGPTVNPTTTTKAITDTLTIGPYRWPHRILVTWRVLLQAPTGNLSNTYVNVNGVADGYGQVNGTGSTFATLEILNEGTGGSSPAAATTLIGGLEKFTGPDTVTAVMNDPRYSRLTALVVPTLGAAAADPV